MTAAARRAPYRSWLADTIASTATMHTGRRIVAVLSWTYLGLLLFVITCGVALIATAHPAGRPTLGVGLIGTPPTLGLWLGYGLLNRAMNRD